MHRLKCLSLFSNVGIAETYFKNIGIDVLIANEIIEERANFYKHLYPNTKVICGDIVNNNVRKEIIKESLDNKIDFILATPPCQGMSRHGSRNEDDIRNYLIYYAIDVIKKVKPKFVLIENVTQILTTKIKVNKEKTIIFDYIKDELKDEYDISDEVIFNTADYGIAQNRKRCLIRIKSKKCSKIKWNNPKKEKKVSLYDCIGNLPSLDPLLREENMRYKFPEYETKKNEGLKISKWFYPPTHSWRQVEWMIHTPSGKTAVENKIYYPKKENRKIDARLSCYRRYAWTRPANTVTQNNGVISSACCVHPGRPIINSKNEKKRQYSDPRVLTIYELMLISSLPKNWNIPSWASERMIRKVIGEGVPPKLTMKIMKELMKQL